MIITKSIFCHCVTVKVVFRYYNTGGVSSYKQIESMRFRAEEFPKTASKKIKKG